MLFTYLDKTFTLKIHLTVIQNIKMQPINKNGHIDESTTLRINVDESKTDILRSFTKQSIERNTVVTSVVYLTGLNADVTVSGSFKFMESDTDTI